MKVGRNEPCPCGSGKKFKHCHGVMGLQPVHTSDDLAGIGKNAAAQERIRQTQQGLGKPIIATRWLDQQVVAVGDKLYYSKTWKTFIGFLGDYLKSTFGSDWGNDEIAKPLAERHPLMQWDDALFRLKRRQTTVPGQIAHLPLVGFVACYFSVAYNLYLLEHNVTLQALLIKRLKDPRNFQGAYYELQVARAFLLAGFTLELEDETDPSKQHCEFNATSPVTGKKYWVEAKMRGVAGELGRTTADGGASSKPLSTLIKQLNRALAKPADNERMIFLDLNAEMPTNISQDSPPALMEDVNRRLAKYETKELQDGKRAYLFVTNLNFHKKPGELAQGLAWLVGLGIPDFARPGLIRLSDFYMQGQKHADALLVAEELARILNWPTTFDGSLPSNLVGGEPPPILIGESYCFEGAGRNGKDIVGTVINATMLEEVKSVLVEVRCADDSHCVFKLPVSETQVADYQAHPDAYFGEIVRPQKEVKTPLEFFEVLMHSFADMSREELLGYLGGHVNGAEAMHTDHLRAIFCEGLVVSEGIMK